MSDIEGKAAREATSKPGRRASFNVAGAGLQLPYEAITGLNHAALLRWLGASFTPGRGHAWGGGWGPKLGISAIQQPGTLLMN